MFGDSDTESYDGSLFSASINILGIKEGFFVNCIYVFDYF